MVLVPMGRRGDSAPLRKIAFSGLAISVLLVLIAPVLHWVPLPDWVQSSIAGLLDDLEPRIFTFPDQLLRSTGWTVFNPEGYHGPETWTTSGSKADGFFEGWYYKMVTVTGQTLVVIPGVIHGKVASNGTAGFAFVMVVDPTEAAAQRVQLHRYSLQDVAASHNEQGWSLQIGPNTFSKHSLLLAMNRSGQMIHGRVDMLNTSPWPATLLLPDVMGWFAWLPGMECRHGVVSLHSSTRGAIFFGREEVRLDGGVAYIEKDWGSSFPKTWVWIQSNHFVREGGGYEEGTLLLSIASIPFPSDKIEAIRFRGFLGCLWLPQLGGLFRFATYTGAVIEKLVTSANRSRVEIVIRSAQHRLLVSAEGDRQAAALLHGPTPGGKFEPFVNEMLGASVAVQLIRLSDGRIIFQGRGGHSGLEIESIESGGSHLLDTAIN